MGAGGNVVTRSGLAETFGVSTNTIDAWLRRGCPYLAKPKKRGGSWQFNTATVYQWRQEVAAEEAIEHAPERLRVDARARREEIETAMAELELGKQAGQLLDREETIRFIADVLVTVQSGLATLAPAASMELAPITDVRDLQHKLDAHVRQVAHAMADHIERLGGVLEDARGHSGVEVGR